MGLLDFAQAASNAAASTVTGPVDLLSMILQKMGLNVGTAPVGGTEWAKRQGLMRDVQQGPAQVAGETAGLLGPVAIPAKAAQVARGLLKMADNAAAPSMLRPDQGAIVWHGSPHKFDRFDSSKIGTGEGAQAYGHGLYLAESPDVAKSYADSVSRLHGATTTVEGAGRKVPVPLWAADRVRNEGINSLINEWTQRLAQSEAAAKNSLQPWIEQSNAARFAQQLDELRAIKGSGNVKVEAPGSLYKVDLPDPVIARMLDWDKPLSQQPSNVVDAFLPRPVERGSRYYLDSNVRQGGFPFASLSEAENEARAILRSGQQTGAELYDTAGAMNDIAAAAKLRQLGVPGIRYLDGGSRGAGAGTSNYVVFPGEESILTILERNGIPLR